jgi:hypothetical protein
MPLTLEVISDDRRRTEDEINREFASIHPSVLGALLDAVAVALDRLPQINLARKSRMADFVTWVVAGEPRLGFPEGDFQRAYARARAEAIATNVDTSTVGQFVINCADKGGFTGTATALLDSAGENVRRASDWPKSARGLSAELRRLAPSLRTMGVGVDFTKDKGRGRSKLIVISRAEQNGNFASAESDASASDSTGPSGADAKADPLTQNSGNADATSGAIQIRLDDADAADAESRASSSICKICNRRDLCNECLDGVPDSERCSSSGCVAGIYMYDASGRAWCERHAVAGVAR